MNKYFQILISIILIYASYFIYKALERGEMFKKVSEINMENKKCHKIPYKNPIEDFVVLDEHTLIGSSLNVPHLYHKLSYLDDYKFSK